MRPFGLKYDKEHYKRLEGTYVKKIDQLYKLAIREAISVKQLIGEGVDPDKPFSFSHYPQVKEKVDKMFQSFAFKFEKTIIDATETEWLAAAKKNDELVDRVLKTTNFKKSQVEHLYNRNLEALGAFQKRKSGSLGLRLSDRVWKYTRQFRGEIEMALDVVISEGRPATELAVDMQKYLRKPDQLFRRVRDLRGNLVMSKAAREFQPGPGVYKSSYKNSLRLTRSEINMAYRASDWERWQQLDFVVGIEVRRSNRVFACDVCETLKGRYPKDFKFYAWHPQCRCHAIAILSTTEEFIEREKKRMAGEELPPMRSVNEVRETPDSFKNWIVDNQDRINRAKTKPYFITDNLLFSGTKNLKNEVGILVGKAKASGAEIDLLGKELARKHKGYVTPINYKSADSITRKVTTELKGAVYDVKDSVRNTIIVPKGQMNTAIKDMTKDSRFIRVKRQLHDTDPMGYSGVISNVRAKNGVIGEVQLNTDKMIYAKNSPSSAQKLIGKKRWNEIRKETGLEGGLGHKYYEEWRVLPPESLKAIELTEKSKAYYSNFQ